MIKKFPTLLTFFFTNSMNSNMYKISKFDEILSTPRFYKIGVFLHPGKNHALNERNDSTPRIQTLFFFSLIFCKELVCKKVAVMICAGLVPREIILISGCTYKLQWPAKEIMTGIKRTKFNPNIRAKGPIEWGFL